MHVYAIFQRVVAAGSAVVVAATLNDRLGKTVPFSVAAASTATTLVVEADASVTEPASLKALGIQVLGAERVPASKS